MRSGFLLASIGQTFTGTAGTDPTDLAKVIHDKVSFQQVVAELPKTCPDCTDWLNGKNFDPDKLAEIQDIVAATANLHGLTLNEFLVIAEDNGLYGLHNGNNGGIVAVNMLTPDGLNFSSGRDRVFTFGHEAPGHSSGGGEDYADLMGNYAVGAMDLSNRLNGRERITDTGSVNDWRAAYGDTEFVRYNNAWASFLAAQPDTNKREDGYDRHALGQKTYEELLVSDIARDERDKNKWGHVTGPMLAFGEVARGGFELGTLVAQCGVSWITFGEYCPEAGGKLWDTAVSLPENIVAGVKYSIEEIRSGDSHQMWHGWTNLAMLIAPFAKAKGVVAAEGGALSLRAGTATAAEFDAAAGAAGRGISAAEAAGSWFDFPAWKGETAATQAVGRAGRSNPAHNAAAARSLAEDLRRQEAASEAASAFTQDGKLKMEVVNSAREIISPGELKNPAIPENYGKYTTETIRSPSGDFQVHFYKNKNTGDIFYNLDYKIKFNDEFWWKR